MTKADELLAKMRPLPCAECGKRTLSEHICVVSELSNEALADRLDDIIPGYTQDEAQWPALKEAAKRLCEYDNNILKAQLEQVKDIVTFMQTFVCDVETIENEFL